MPCRPRPHRLPRRLRPHVWWCAVQRRPPRVSRGIPTRASARPSESESPSSAFQTSHDGASFWLSGRVGYNFPTFYVFAQGDGIFQRFRNSIFDTNGYRVIGGLGTNDANSLFKGEVYGGYQAQNQQQQNVLALGFVPNVLALGVPQDVNSPVFGGRLSYFPTEYWTIIAQVDTILGISTLLSPSIPLGAPTRTITAILQTTYGLSRQWSVGVRGGYTQAEFIGVSGLDNHSWLAGASFNCIECRNCLLNSRLPIHDRGLECGVLQFYAQLGQCWPYI